MLDWPHAVFRVKPGAMSYERESLKQVHGYIPGKQPQSRDITKLNTNENPYPPSEAVMAALASVMPEDLRRYPVPFADPFREVAAVTHGVEADQVIATNGGDELLRLAISTFVEPGAPIGLFEPSYSLYPVLAALNQSPVVRVNLAADWSRPSHAAATFNGAGVPLVFMVSPHAPSGRLAAVEEVRALAEQLDGVLLVDEAYVDFVDPALAHDVVPLVHELDNVLILRTLSKGYSLAGLRFGYGMGAKPLIEPMLVKTRDSYNADVVAQRLACAALSSREAAAVTWQAVRSERERLTQELTRRGFEVPESQSNFVLATVPEDQDAARLSQALEEGGVMIRYFSDARLADKLRVTVGSPGENARFLEVLDRVMG